MNHRIVRPVFRPALAGIALLVTLELAACAGQSSTTSISPPTVPPSNSTIIAQASTQGDDAVTQVPTATEQLTEAVPSTQAAPTEPAVALAPTTTTSPDAVDTTTTNLKKFVSPVWI